MRILLIVAALLTGCATAPLGASPGQANKDLVLAFYAQALNGRQPAEAFAHYAATDFVEHSQDSAGSDIKATVEFLSGLLAKNPNGHWEVVRAIAEGDLVMVHARYVPAPGGPEIAIAEIFRIRDGKLVEHWDVISGPPDNVINPQSRFAGPATVSAPPSSAQENKKLVLAFYGEIFNSEWSPSDDPFARFVGADYVEHSQSVPGSDLKATARAMAWMRIGSPHEHCEVVRSIAEGDLVMVHARFAAAPGAPESALAEIFRVRAGKIVEHWDVSSDPPAKVVNPQSRF